MLKVLAFLLVLLMGVVPSVAASVVCGGVNDSPAINAAIATATAQGESVGVSGICLINSPIVFADAGYRGADLHGHGAGVTQFISGSGISGLWMFQVAQAGMVSIHDLYFASYNGQTTGIGVLVTGNPSLNNHQNFGSRFYNLSAAGFSDVFQFQYAQAFTIDGIIANGFGRDFLYLQNVNVPDAGAGMISNFVVNGAAGSDAFVRQFSNGGLRIVNGAINAAGSGMSFCYVANFSAGVSTSDLAISNIHCEGINTSGFRFDLPSTTDFSNIGIDNFEVLAVPGSAAKCLDVLNNGPQNVLALTVSGGQCRVGSATTVAIDINGTQGFTIGGIAVISPNINNTRKIVVRSNSSNGVVGPIVGTSSGSMPASTIAGTNVTTIGQF